MITDIFTHQYFWLSFLPIALMGGLNWLLWFDRVDDKKEPLGNLLLALLAGVVSVLVILNFFADFLLTSLWAKVALEELAKILAAIGVMEIFQRKFSQVSQGIMYGFAVGIGFALFENIAYLVEAYGQADFSADFWMIWQGRLWTSTLLHGITTAFFGMVYAGAYLSATVHKDQRESPLRAFFVPPNFRQLFDIFPLHVVRKHLIFGHQKTLKGHYARAVILEGIWFAILLHGIFNLALVYKQPIIAFVVAGIGLIFLVGKK